MRYFKIDLKTNAGAGFEELQNKEFSYYCKGVEHLISYFNDVDMRSFVSEWTVKEYSDSQCAELISECGSNHPINAGAIFFTIFDEEAIAWAKKLY